MTNRRQKTEDRSQRSVFITFLLALTVYAPTCFAGTIVTSSVDGGGGRSASASYANDASVGGIGGISSVGSQVTRHGYPGQLIEVTSVSVTGVPVQVNEGSTAQLTGTATLDDATVASLTGSDLMWNIPYWPIQNISASGVASAAAVYANTPGTVSGRYLGVLGVGSLLVVDSLPDNFGSYAGDGLPDWWQNHFFGLDNANAAPSADADGTGQNNLFKYVAGLDPTNAAARFSLRIESVAGQPTQKRLVFSPRWSDRTYTPLSRTNLAGGASWTNLTTSSTADNGTECTVMDLNATGQAKFYRIQITYP